MREIPWLHVFLLTLAANQIVETWHHGSIFADWRSYWSARGGFLGQLLSCPFCLNHWSTMLLAASYVCLPCLPLTAGRVFDIVVLWLALVRTSTALNDGLYGVTRMHSATPPQETL